MCHMLLGKGVTKVTAGIVNSFTFSPNQNMKCQADSAMAAKEKSKASQEAQCQGGNDDPSQQLLHCSSNPHPHQNVQPFWTSHVSFRDKREEERERESSRHAKKTRWEDFFPLTDIKRKTGTISRDCLQPFQNIKSVYRNVLRKKTAHVFTSIRNS